MLSDTEPIHVRAMQMVFSHNVTFPAAWWEPILQGLKSEEKEIQYTVPYIN